MALFSCQAEGSMRLGLIFHIFTRFKAVIQVKGSVWVLQIPKSMSFQWCTLDRFRQTDSLTLTHTYSLPHSLTKTHILQLPGRRQPVIGINFPQIYLILSIQKKGSVLVFKMLESMSFQGL